MCLDLNVFCLLFSPMCYLWILYIDLSVICGRQRVTTLAKSSKGNPDASMVLEDVYPSKMYSLALILSSQDDFNEFRTKCVCLFSIRFIFQYLSICLNFGYSCVKSV
jgi:hypothetical protein